MPTLPVALTINASVLPARTRKGKTVEEVAPVWMLSKAPVPLVVAAVVREKRLFVPVPVAQLKAVVLVPIERESAEAGAVSDDQAVADDPEQAPQVGVPPLDETRQSVPAPPVEVVLSWPLALV